MTRPGYTDEELRRAVASAVTYADVCRAVGVVPRGANYEVLRRAIAAAGIDDAHLRQRVQSIRERRARLTEDENAIRTAVATSRTFASAIRALGYEPDGTTYRMLHEAIARFGIETSHMLGRGWSTGHEFPARRRTLGDYLVIDGPRIGTSDLRERLLSEGVKDHRCEDCGLTEWRRRPVPLELDHVNGDRHDNRLENLRLLCPNCHALTPTYRGRNIGAYASDEAAAYDAA